MNAMIHASLGSRAMASKHYTMLRNGRWIDYNTDFYTFSINQDLDSEWDEMLANFSEVHQIRARESSDYTTLKSAQRLAG